MAHSIGEDAIKISFIQTMPGEELCVVRELKKACKDYGVERYALLKGFGSFDVVFIYSATNFDSVLTRYGAIPGILKTSRSFCFQYNKIHNRDLFDDLKSFPLSTLSLLKLNPYKEGKPYENEKAILKTIKDEKGVRKYALGTLGWNELILITSGNNFNDVFLQSFWAINSPKKRDILKTYSFVAIQYDILSEIDYQETVEEIKSKLDAQPCFNDEILNTVYPAIKITLNPVNTSVITKYWEENGLFSVSHFIGKNDLLVKPSMQMKWSMLLAKLLKFRKLFSNAIISTSTGISTTYATRKEVLSVFPDFKLDGPTKYIYSDLEKLFGDEAYVVANTFNTFRGLTENVTIRDAFSDMLEYPAYIQSYAKNLQDETKRANFSVLTSEYLKRGAELRIYGTHGTIDESVGQFTRLRGGVQRSLSALSLLPHRLLLKHTPFTWKGFTTSGPPLFYNFREVINVPPNALWGLDLWWGLYHEIAHLIVDKIPNLINEDVKELKPFLCQKRNEVSWLDLLTEMTAEYLGFAMGFYGNYDLFLKKLWSYLSQLTPQQTLPAELQFYAVRSFFVDIVDRHYNREPHEVTKDKIEDLDWVYSQICKHIDSIAVICGQKSPEMQEFFSNKYYIAANYASIFRELYSWLDLKLMPLVKELQFHDNKDHLEERNTTDALNCIYQGKMFDGELLYPQSVLYKVLNRYDGNEVPFNVSMAVILTFWNNNAYKGL